MNRTISMMSAALLLAGMAAATAGGGDGDWRLSVGDAAPHSVVFAPGEQPGQVPDRPDGRPSTLVPAVRDGLATVRMPEPRQFQINDLVQIVVDESAESDSTARLDTSKDMEIDAAVEAFVDLGELLKARVEPTAMSGGRPEVSADMGNRFAGSGNYSRRDSLHTRIQARIIDIKPNGNLVLEASKHIRSDRESVSIVLTGICRADDVTADNTVRSNQLHDLRVIKEHDGELKGATRKGIITQVIEGLFAF